MSFALRCPSTGATTINTLMTQATLDQLAAKLDQLIRTCERLDQENKTLRQKEATWQLERRRLIEKNELARSRVEAMIARLKSLEAET